MGAWPARWGPRSLISTAEVLQGNTFWGAHAARWLWSVPVPTGYLSGSVRKDGGMAPPTPYTSPGVTGAVFLSDGPQGTLPEGPSFWRPEGAGPAPPSSGDSLHVTQAAWGDSHHLSPAQLRKSAWRRLRGLEPWLCVAGSHQELDAHTTLQTGGGSSGLSWTPGSWELPSNPL